MGAHFGCSCLRVSKVAYSRLRVCVFGRIQDYILDYRFVGFITTKETKIRKWILQCASNSEFTRQDGKAVVCDKRHRVFTCKFCRDLHLTLKESEVWRKVVLKQNYCHAWHSWLAGFVRLSFCCVSSLILAPNGDNLAGIIINKTKIKLQVRESEKYPFYT